MAKVYLVEKTNIPSSIVESVATGTSNGTISVKTNGSTANVAVKGLGTAAYTATTAYAAASHTHSYAGAASAGASATSAVKLDTATAGSATRPVYFTGGKPVQCTYTLNANVPAGARPLLRINEGLLGSLTKTDNTYYLPYASGASIAIIEVFGQIAIVQSNYDQASVYGSRTITGMSTSMSKVEDINALNGNYFILGIGADTTGRISFTPTYDRWNILNDLGFRVCWYL